MVSKLSSKKPLVAIIGETASGKTSAAIELAKRISGEIICADSRTVYKDMDIGTAKPTASERKEVAHHLIDVVRPDESFSAAKFQSLANKCIQQIEDRGNTPILVGGSGLYVDAVLYNFQFSNQANSNDRERLNQMSDEELTTLLHTKKIDASSLNTKNRRHTIRAIERAGQPQPIKSALRGNTIILGLRLERDELNLRIDERVEQMFRDGVVDEVKELANKYGWENEAMSGIGYRVIRQYLEGGASLDEVKAAFKARDRSLAKRQRTWFKRNPDIKWFEDKAKLIEYAVEFVDSFD